MIAVIDLQISNIRSVVRALERIGAAPIVTTDADLVVNADIVLLPGVGSFGDGMVSLRAKSLVEPLQDQARRGTPIIGICLGMQLLAASSEEHGHHEGLNLLPGKVVRLHPDSPGFRVPNIGWCDLHLERHQTVLPAEVDGRAVYFTHSYHLVCDNPLDVMATIRYANDEVAVAVQHGSLIGLQFHPEKSQDVGLRVLASVLHAFAALGEGV